MSGVEGIVRDMILVYSSTKYFILLASDVVAEGLNFKASFAKMPLKKKRWGGSCKSDSIPAGKISQKDCYPLRHKASI